MSLGLPFVSTDRNVQGEEAQRESRMMKQQGGTQVSPALALAEFFVEGQQKTTQTISPESRRTRSGAKEEAKDARKVSKDDAGYFDAKQIARERKRKK